MLTWLNGCATVTAPANQPPPMTPEEQRAWLLGGAGELHDAPSEAMLDPQSLLEVDDEMRAFAHQAADKAWTDSGKVYALVDALQSPKGLGLHYDVTATLTAREAFEQRRANCISYTLLFVALAREVGVEAHFNDVQIPPVWDLRDQTLVLYRHIDARVGGSSEHYQIIDVTAEEYDAHYPQQMIRDGAAQAQFFSNRAMDLLSQGARRPALRYQLRALELDTDESFLWSNLAHVYLALNNPGAALAAAQMALHLDPRSLSADGIEAQAYEALGEHDEARKAQRRAQYNMSLNPYYHFKLAAQALQRDQLKRAYDEDRRAILLYPEDHRFFLLLGAVLSRLDQPELARKSIETAIALTSDQNLQARYRSKLSRLSTAKPS